MKLLHALAALALYVTGAWLAAKWNVERTFEPVTQEDEIYTEYEAEER